MSYLRGDRHTDQEEPVPVLRGRRGHDLPVRNGGRCSEQEGADRLHRSVRNPRGRAPHNAFTLGAQVTHPGARVKLDLDERVVLAAEGDTGSREPRQVGRPTCSGRTWTARPPASTQRSTASRGWATTRRETSAPKQWLTAAVYNWGPYYLRRVKAAMNGTWKTGFYYGTMNDGFTSIAPFGSKLVSAKTKAAIGREAAHRRSCPAS